jgi:hypothetical protein
VKSFYSAKAQKWVPAAHLVSNRESTDWNAFVVEMIGMWEAPQEEKAKADLVSPAFYGGNQYRKDENVLGWDMLFLDVDNDDPSKYLSHAGMMEFLGAFGLNFLIYNSPSSTVDAERYRVVIPLSRTVDADEVKPLWKAMWQFTGGLGDPACKDRSRAYYVPGQYQGCDSPFIEGEVNGKPLDVDWLIGAYPPPAPVVPQAAQETEGMDGFRDKLVKASVKAYHRGIFDSNLVTKTILEDYTSNKAGSYHLGMYTALCRIAGRAKTMGYPLTEAELFQIAREIDFYDGGFYSDEKLRAEAKDAMAYVF